MSDHLGNAYPGLAGELRKRSFASLPTPVSHHELELAGGSRTILVKHDDQTSPVYGGNKIRKLEFLVADALQQRGVAGMPTAFVASFGSGKPVLGVLGEYDALPGMSQAASNSPSWPAQQRRSMCRASRCPT